MIFKPMKKDDVLRALQGQENIIAPQVEAHEKFFKNLSCPHCGSGVMAIVNTRKLFSTDGVLPNFLAKCKTCGVEFEPYTGIQISMPEQG